MTLNNGCGAKTIGFGKPTAKYPDIQKTIPSQTCEMMKLPLQELREALLQEEVTADAVERAYLNYLRRLDEVARLEISGLYKDELEDVVHIFARTKGVPPVYYYRRWVDQAYFTAWEKVDISIEGEHLLPEHITAAYGCSGLFSQKR